MVLDQELIEQDPLLMKSLAITVQVIKQRIHGSNVNDIGRMPNNTSLSQISKYGSYQQQIDDENRGPKRRPNNDDNDNDEREEMIKITDYNKFKIQSSI